MENSFVRYLDEFFKPLIEVYNFQIKRELHDAESNTYMIEYTSENFSIKIEKYFREFYTSVNRVNKQDHEINLFNLLQYLKRAEANAPQAQYFNKEKDIEECYRKQLYYISSVLYDNFDSINEFFYKSDYDQNITAFEEFWKNKHPELYR